MIAEHHDDGELAVITEFLAIATMLIAEEEGFADDFRRWGDEDATTTCMQTGCDACALVAWRR